MATTKVTITLDDEQLEAVRQLVDAGQSSSVSGFLRRAVEVALNDVAGWQALLGEALDQTGGPLTDDEIAWADNVLSGAARARVRQRKRAA